MPDGRAKNGGFRQGAGRKADPIKAELRKALDEAVPYDARKLILEMQSTRAQAGDTRAAALILAYLYGKPTDTVDLEESDEDTERPVDFSRLSAEDFDELTFHSAELERLVAKCRDTEGADPGGEGAEVSG